MPKLRPYQESGVEWLMARSRAMLLDEPGLGKTPQVIVAAARLDLERVLIICPAVARTMWERRWREWAPDRPVPRILSYNWMVRNKGQLGSFRRWNPELLVADEAHYLKNYSSQRTSYFYGWANAAEGLTAASWRTWLLTGTPTPNWPDEWFPHVRGLWPARCPEPVKFQRRIHAAYEAWRERYCLVEENLYGRAIRGIRKEHAAELAEILKPVCLRRTVADVLPELPPLIWQDLVLDADEAADTLKRIAQEPAVVEMRESLERGEDFSAQWAAMSTVRRIIGRLKVDGIVDTVQEEMDAGAYRRIVLFGHHREVLSQLEKKLERYKVSTITGETPAALRAKAIDEFQSGVTNVFVGSITACGTAIDLTSADQCILVESSWVPEENFQAAKRLHRIGQSRPVVVRVASLANSIDEAIARVLIRKQSAVTPTLEELTCQPVIS